MKVKALKTLGGAINAKAGEEFEVTNEAQLRDLLVQGVVVPVESNPQEVSKIHNLSGEQLAQSRAELNEQYNLESLACAEAQQEVVNQEIDKLEQKRQQKFQQAKQQATQKAQQAAQQGQKNTQPTVEAFQTQTQEPNKKH